MHANVCGARCLIRGDPIQEDLGGDGGSRRGTSRNPSVPVFALTILSSISPSAFLFFLPQGCWCGDAPGRHGELPLEFCTVGFDTGNWRGSWRGTETAPWRYNLIYRTSVVSPRRARASVALASVCTPAFSCTEPFTMTVTFLFRLRVHYNVFLCGALHMDGVRLHSCVYRLSPHTRTLLPPLPYHQNQSEPSANSI